MNFPPLPERELSRDSGQVDLYTADQMRDYAEQHATSRCEDLMQVLRMVDDNNRVDAGEDRKAWRGAFVESEVRRVLGEA
jgi:hypothetical protein